MTLFEATSGLMNLAAMIQDAGAAIQAAAPEAPFVAGEAAARTDQAARGLRFLTAAYTAVWVILAAYLVLLSVRQRRLERALDRLKRRFGSDPSGP
jgi:CcmD family protein